MNALADLVARAAAQVAALEAGAPALAPAATRPLRAADLMHAGTLDLLTPLLENEELVLAVAAREKSGLTLHEARLVHRGAGAKVVAALASIVRRIEWCSLVAGLEQGEGHQLARVLVHTVLALCTLLSCPFFVEEGPERRTAIREATIGCACATHAPLFAGCGRADAAAPALITLASPGRRYAGCNVYGLAASTATAWAELAASSSDNVRARSMLASCAPTLRQVRPRLPACGRPALRRLPPSRRRAAQVVDHWCTANGAGALAAAPSAVLAQYHSGLCAVLAWLNGAPALPPPPSSRSPPELALLSKLPRAIKEASCKVRAAPLTCSPCAERAADRGLGRRSTCSRRRCCTAGRAASPPTRTPRTWKRSAAPPAATC